jgi:hypothetical protein
MHHGCRYAESGQLAEDQKQAASSAGGIDGGGGGFGYTGHYMDANINNNNADSNKTTTATGKEKWAPPDGMSFKEFKEFKKRQKMKRNGFF